MHEKEPPCLLYTDGSFEPQSDKEAYVGAVLFVPGRESPLFTHCEVPRTVREKWLKRATQIYLVELFAAPLALETFKEWITGRSVIHFVDNNSALGALVKGYSNNEDAIRIVSEYWIRAARFKCNLYIDRVESKSNVSDEPSRPDIPNTFLEELGAEFVRPKSYVFELGESKNPKDWFQ